MCLPVYKALGDLSPQLRPLEEAVVSNRDKWEELSRQAEVQEEEEVKGNKVTRNL